MTRYEMAIVIARFLAQLDSRVADQLEASGLVWWRKYRRKCPS